MLSTLAHAQTTNSAYEGQFFKASVQNISLAKKGGRVFVTLLVRGKSFGNSHNVAIVQSRQDNGCGTLIGAEGESYKPKTCLPLVDNWYGDGGTIIKADTDTLVTFEFNADDPIAPISTSFDFVLPFQLLTCKTNEQAAAEGRNGTSTLDNDGCYAMTYKFSQQSMSFYDIELMP